MGAGLRWGWALEVVVLAAAMASCCLAGVEVRGPHRVTAAMEALIHPWRAEVGVALPCLKIQLANCIMRTL